MRKPINIVAACSARKTLVPEAELEIRQLRETDPAARIHEWVSRINASKSKRVPARDLYMGDAWGIIKPFGETERLWIASAGYGLISDGTSICSYAATFTKAHPDSVIVRNSRSSASEQCASWWSGLWQWQNSDRPRNRIADLARQDPGTPIIVVLSQNYLQALHEDLAAARELLSDPQRLVIISAGSQKTGALKDNYLPCDARLQVHLKGARVSLNSRIARKIITETPFEKLDIVYLRKQFLRLLETCSVPTQRNRSPLTDAEVIRFITETLFKYPASTATSILRSLRETGFACGQTRLKNLFARVRGS